MSSMLSMVKSWERSIISTEEGSDPISMTGRFSSTHVELQEAGDRKSQG